MCDYLTNSQRGRPSPQLCPDPGVGGELDGRFLVSTGWFRSLCFLSVSQSLPSVVNKESIYFGGAFICAASRKYSLPLVRVKKKELSSGAQESGVRRPCSEHLLEVSFLGSGLPWLKGFIVWFSCSSTSDTIASVSSWTGLF